MSARRGSVPLPFPGTDDELTANFLTHGWTLFVDDDDPPIRISWEPCRQCGAKTHHVAATWPCGVEPPRGGEVLP